MKTGRNDPCPCGSGKKYKSCCMAADQAREPAVHAPVGGAGPGAWEAGFVRLPVKLAEDDAAPTILLVVEGGVVLFHQLNLRPPADPEEEAREIELAIRAASRDAGRAPGQVLVRGGAVAAALASAGLPALVATVLPGLDFVAAELGGAMAELHPPPPATSPQTWAGWGLPAARVAELFRAGAAFYRAAPWEVFSDRDVIEAELSGGRRWAVCVMGSGGMQYGLALYEQMEDYLRMFAADGADEAFAELHGFILSLGFESRDILPEAMLREVRKAGWEVAGPAAYPHLIALNAPAGGIASAVEDLAVVLRAVARVAAEGPPDPDADEDLAPEWRDPESGVTLRFSEVVDVLAGSPWDPPARLRPACAEGPGAEPAAAFEGPHDMDALLAVEEAVVGRFAEWLGHSGVSQATVEKHASNAGLFVEFLVRWGGVPPRAVTEFDLRVFLYDWYPRKVQDARTRALAVPTSLRRFFAFLAEREGIACPWADPVLRDREAYEMRYDEFPGGFWWDEGVREWQAELYDDLEVRVFLPVRAMAGGGAWGEAMGPVEAALHGELGRRWLVWRDEVVRAGTDAPEAVRRALAARQREWEKTRHPGFGGKTPAQAVRAERKAGRRGS